MNSYSLKSTSPGCYANSDYIIKHYAAIYSVSQKSEDITLTTTTATTTIGDLNRRRVAWCPVFHRTVRFLGGKCPVTIFCPNRTMPCPVFGRVLSINKCSVAFFVQERHFPLPEIVKNHWAIPAPPRTLLGELTALHSF